MEQADVRVVVVEDNRDNLALMLALLAHRYEAIPCDDPARALDVIRAHRPHLVLLDIGLPKVAGPRILDFLRRSASVADTPVVAVTADVHPDSEQHWLHRGFDGYVAKPIVDKTLLWATIDALARTPAHLP